MVEQAAASVCQLTGETSVRQVRLHTHTHARMRALTLLLVSDLQVCEPGWDKFQGFCYRHFSSRQSWDAAEQHCRMCGGHLLSVMTPEEQEHVNGNAQPPHASFSAPSQRWLCCFRGVPRVSVDRPERQNHRGRLPLVGREPSGQICASVAPSSDPLSTVNVSAFSSAL